MNIPLSQIAVLDRARYDTGDLASLAASIKTNGQISAGVVRRATEEDASAGVDVQATPFILVAGGRRYAACALAGVETFRADDFGELPPLQQKVLELEENLHRKDLTWDEEAALRKRIHELYREIAKSKGEKWTLMDTARATGESIATYSRDLDIAGAIEGDPSLKLAGTKKAAIRIIEMRDHLARREAQNDGTRRSIGKLQSHLVEADAQNWLRVQGTASTDLFLSDFPYGINYGTAGQKVVTDNVSHSDFDDSEGVALDLFIDVVPEILRITKPTGWICIFMSETNLPFLQECFESCCTTHFEYGHVDYISAGDEMAKLLPTHCEAGDPGVCRFIRAEVPRWIWYRPNSRNPGRLPELHAKNFYENILVLNRGKAKLYKQQDECPNVLVYNAEYGDDRIHVNQKPRDLARELVQRFTIPGDLVVDSFFGSGNLLAGAAEVQRRIAGCEKNPLMIDLAIGNVSRYYSA